MVIVLALWLAAWLLTERTLFGKYVRAIGQNGEAARIAGIRDRRTMLWVLVAASALCAVGGVILSANLRQFTPLYLPGLPDGRHRCGLYRHRL